MTLTIANHGFTIGDRIMMTDESIQFSCGFGGASGNDAIKAYPRSTDPISNKWVPVTNITQNTFDIQVLASTPSTNTDAHTFHSAAPNGVKVSHEAIFIEEKSLVFKCLADSNGSEHKYPRPNGYGGASADDPYYDTTVPIISATDTTVTVSYTHLTLPTKRIV